MVIDLIIGTGTFAIVALVLKNNNDNSKKISKVYERVDKVKENQDGTYVRKDMCALTHKQVSDDLAEIKTNINKLLERKGS